MLIRPFRATADCVPIEFDRMNRLPLVNANRAAVFPGRTSRRLVVDRSLLSRAVKKCWRRKFPSVGMRWAASVNRFPCPGRRPILAQPRQLARGWRALGDRVSTPNLMEIPKIYHPRLTPDRSARARRRCECRQRAGRRASPRLAGPAPGRRRPLGRRHRPLRRRHGRERR